jgi:hypothetical protein
MDDVPDWLCRFIDYLRKLDYEKILKEWINNSAYMHL